MKTEMRPAIEVIAIGVSTGGPTVLKTIFENLTDYFPPILVVQHISPGFLPMMVDLLKQQTHKNIMIAKEGEAIKSNMIYVAPDHTHMGVSKQHTILLSRIPPENNIRPAVSFLLRSVTQVFGAKALGILLTGMGHDGVAELKIMKDGGATTLVQNKESSVVYGMAGSAVEKKAVSFILTPQQIAEFINRIDRGKSHG
jgi:two-component system chemotaxis response regulator CheB